MTPDLLGVSDDGYLNTGNDVAELLLHLRDKYLADVAEPEAGAEGVLADAHPDDVALPRVPEALGEVQIKMDAPLQDGLEVLQHLLAEDVHQDGDGRHAALRELVKVLAYDGYPPVHHIVFASGAQQLIGHGLGRTSRLDVGVRAADGLTFE